MNCESLKNTTGNFDRNTVEEPRDPGTVRTPKEDQPLRLLLNLLFYHINSSEPTYKSQRMKLLEETAACSQ